MYNATIENTYKRFKTWLNVGATASITDIVLDYLNRGQRRIANERKWDCLELTTNLSLDSNNSAILPDLDTIIEIYVDSANDGKPDYYFYNGGRVNNGYEITNTFSQSAGWVKTIQFFTGTSETPILKYKKLVADFTSDYANEYSIFPEDLVLRASQLEHMEEAGLDSNTYQMILADYEKKLKNAIMSYEDSNVDMRSEILDEAGARILTENNFLDGSDEWDSINRYADNSQL